MQAEAVSRSGEADLVHRAAGGDPAAIRSLIRANNRRLFRIARSVVGDDGEAEDVLQEAYLRAFRGLESFRGESAFGTWLGRIVINEALGRVRRRRPTVEWTEAMEESANAEIIPFPGGGAPPDPERGAAQRQIARLLESAIDALPPDFRTVLIARAVEGMSIEETADLLDLKPETVKTRLHRARRLLRVALAARVDGTLADSFPFDGWRCEAMAARVLTRLGFPS